MDLFQNQDQIINILQQCFPKADKIQITENYTNDESLNLISNIIHLTFNVEEDGLEYKKSLVLKVPNNWEVASFSTELDLFSRETFMYDVILPLVNSYLDKSITPIYYKTIDSKIIILENLAASGYGNGENNGLLFNLQQSLASIKTLAHFHAASYKVGHTNPQLLQNKMFIGSPFLELTPKVSLFWEPIFAELLASNNMSHLIPRLKKIHLDLRSDQIKSKTHYSNYKFFVLNHSDYRKDNILMKYDPHNEVEEVKIVDFQGCYFSSPVLDFVYFFFSSTQVEVTQNHYETLLNSYLEYLNTKLKKISCNAVYTREDFEGDIKSLYFYPFLCTMYTAFILYPQDHTQLLETIMHQKTEHTQHYREACLTDELFTNKLLSVIQLCEKLGFYEA